MSWNMNNYSMSTDYESLNAKLMSHRQIANTFITPRSFSELTTSKHHIVIGPRGSGKTTMLRMLELPSLVNWVLSDNITQMQSIDYISAFIPTDRAWANQWALIDTMRISEKHRECLKEALFTTHTVRAIVESVYYCNTSGSLKKHQILSKLAFCLEQHEESTLVKQLSEILKLEVKIPSFEGLIFQLRRRLQDIGYVIKKCVVLNESIVLDNMDYIYDSFIDVIEGLIEQINYAIGKPNQKWTLLCDELELAPDTIREGLINSLRSGFKNILFKLSICPYSKDFELFTKPESPSQGHDYNPIYLWYPSKKDTRAFCRELGNKIKDSFGIEDSLMDIFSISPFDRAGAGKKAISAYSPNSPTIELYKELAKRDKSFQLYLKRKKVDLDKVQEMTEDERAEKIRKVIGPVVIRHSFRKSDGNKRSRKNPKLYTGLDSLFDATEGNPRTFISMIAPLLKAYLQESSTTKYPPKISKNKQAQALVTASNRFRTLIGTIPVKSEVVKRGYSSINAILDLVGKNFHESINGMEFNPEPTLNFTVDEDTPDMIKGLLGDALNIGAIINLQDEPGTPLLGTLVGRSFRLNYILAPYYKIPLLRGRTRSLSRLLEPSPDSEQTSLLFGQELIDDYTE